MDFLQNEYSALRKELDALEKEYEQLTLPLPLGMGNVKQMWSSRNGGRMKDLEKITEECKKKLRAINIPFDEEMTVIAQHVGNNTWGQYNKTRKTIKVEPLRNDCMLRHSYKKESP